MTDTARSDAVLERLLTLHPKRMDLSLGRLLRLLDALGRPQLSLPPVVHVAGTNGKGSTLAVVRAGIEAAGKSAHVYTSPHLARFHERIRVAGALIGEDALIDALTECEIANAGQPITFFEITTAAALLEFSRVPADFCLLEVGLGGRLDSTNVVDRPAVAAITPVSLDHQQYLGDTIAEIAREKAGVLKRGAPAVIAPQTAEAMASIEDIAARVGARLIVAGQDYHAGLEDGRLVYRDGAGLLDMAPPRLAGEHQIVNAGAGVAILRALGIADEAVEQAPGSAEWPARIQRLTKGQLADRANAAGAELWLDGGHNEAAGAALASHFASMPRTPTHLICGMLETKDPAAFLGHFASLADGLTGVAIRDSEAGYSADEVAGHASSVGIDAAPADTIGAALDRALGLGAKRVLICGSLYLAGDVLRGGAG